MPDTPTAAPTAGTAPATGPSIAGAVLGAVGVTAALVGRPLRSVAAAWADGVENAAGAVGRTGRHAVHRAEGLTDSVTALFDAGENRARRRMWSRPGRAHIEVRGLTGHGDRHRRLARGVTEALRDLEGVRWAEVNAVLGQVVVDADEEGFDLEGLLDVVETVEEEHGTHHESFAGRRPPHPFDPTPAVLASASLVADCLGLALSAARRVTPVRVFSPALRVPLVVAEAQPRIRRYLGEQLGRPHADMVLGVAHAVTHAVTDGATPLALDALQRLLQLAEIRTRQQVWERREDELVRAGELPEHAPDRLERPVPLPKGPVEKCGDRTSLAALIGAGGLLAWARRTDRAADVMLATVPKAAGAGREAFVSWLARGLARGGAIPMNPSALRTLDRVSAVVIDSGILCAPRPLLESVTARDGLDDAEAWSAAHAVLSGRSVADLAHEGPWENSEWGLRRPHGAPIIRPDDPGGLVLELYAVADGRPRASTVVCCELDPLADAVVSAARSGSRRLVLTEHTSAGELLAWAHRTLPDTASMTAEVRNLQAEGGCVLLIARHDHALAAADLGVSVLARSGIGDDGAGWAADLICGPGLEQVWRVLHAVDEARRVSCRSVQLSLGGSALGALLAVSRTGRKVGGHTTSPVYGAAFLALLSGIGSARRVHRRKPPPARVRGAWHALGARETVGRLHALRGPG
ncbi:heavy metal translocating P-type ATPase, partial [Streptomyces sp. MTZ3.1]